MSENVSAESVQIICEEPAVDDARVDQEGDENNVAASMDEKPPSGAHHLRVGQLREDDGNSSVYTSDEEGGSHHDASDDPDHRKSPEPEFQPPTDELRDKIIAQVEFYFSDANILKDAFLLKHVRRNKLGYVNIKLITSFKKVKSLTKDYRVVAYSLRQSSELEVNDEGKKVKRKNPLPDWDETTPSRSIVAVNMPMENPSVENVAELFSKCGDIALIRIIRPGKSIPQDVKKYAAKHNEIGTTTCAVVEFEMHESAKQACQTMTNSNDWRNGMRVVLLAQQKKKDKKSSKDEKEDGKCDEGGVENGEKKKKRRERRKKNRVDELAHENESSCYTSSGSEAEPSNCRPTHHQKSLSPMHLDPNRLSPSTSPRSSPKTSPMTSPRSRRRNQHGKSPLIHGSPGGSPRPSPRSSPESSRKKYDYSSGGDSAPSSPWIQRRLKAAGEKSPLAGGVIQHLVTVIRQPKGPDGTNGFIMSRCKPRSSTFS